MTSYSPVNGATNFVENANLSLTFGENVTAVSGKNIVIKKASDDSTVETIAANDTAKVTASSGTVTINPAANLPVGSYYPESAGSQLKYVVTY